MAHTPTTNLLACIPIVEIMILKKGLNNEREDPQSLQLCVLFRKKRCPFFVEQVRQAYPRDKVDLVRGCVPPAGFEPGSPGLQFQNRVAMSRRTN